MKLYEAQVRIQVIAEKCHERWWLLTGTTETISWRLYYIDTNHKLSVSGVENIVRILLPEVKKLLVMTCLLGGNNNS